MGKLINLTGKKFGRLIILERDFSRKQTAWLCVCKCGKKKVVHRSALLSGNTKSCGCYNSEQLKLNKKTHGMRKTRFYRIFTGIKDRCGNKKTPLYIYYGSRGIKCEWKSFEQFRDDMYDSYLEHCKKFGEKETTIDRIDNKGNYTKENCRWATMKEQNNNSRNCHFLTFNGETKSIQGWATKLGTSKGTLWARINSGWKLDRALTEPVVKGKNQNYNKSCANKLGIKK